MKKSIFVILAVLLVIAVISTAGCLNMVQVQPGPVTPAEEPVIVTENPTETPTGNPTDFPTSEPTKNQSSPASDDLIYGIWSYDGLQSVGGKFTVIMIFQKDNKGFTYLVDNHTADEIQEFVWMKNSDGSYTKILADGKTVTYLPDKTKRNIVVSGGSAVFKKLSSVATPAGYQTDFAVTLNSSDVFDSAKSSPLPGVWHREKITSPSGEIAKVVDMVFEPNGNGIGFIAEPGKEDYAVKLIWEKTSNTTYNVKTSEQENLVLLFDKTELTLTDNIDSTFIFEKRNDYSVDLHI